MENKSNTLLLTVIAVATLLVAVIGATFAYFTAQISGNTDSETPVVVRSATLEINFADGSSYAFEDYFTETYFKSVIDYAKQLGKDFERMVKK
jgi:hypothetical protein